MPAAQGSTRWLVDLTIASGIGLVLGALATSITLLTNNYIQERKATRARETEEHAADVKRRARKPRRTTQHDY